MPTVTKPRPKPKAKTTATTPKAAVKSPPKPRSAPKAPAKATKAEAPAPAVKAVKTRAAKAAAPTAVEPKDAAQVRRGGPRLLDLNGYVPNSDSALIAAAMIEGGADRSGVNDRASELITASNGITTRNGTVKNIPSLGAGILRQLKEKGYTVESTWRLVPPADIAAALKKEAQAAARKAARSAKSK